MLRSLIACACVALLPLMASAVTMKMVTVGDPGNAPDPLNTNAVPGIGSVDYVYQIGKFEVQNSEYVEFLNAMAATDTYGLYNSSMGSEPWGGIIQLGSSGTYTYSVKENMGDKPVNYVSFYDAVRFVNWLENGQPTGVQGPGTTESGSYTLFTDAASNTTNASIRNPEAAWVLPTENERYKAAYYDPGPSGPSEDYWVFPTRSNVVPTLGLADATGNITNDGPNVGNFNLAAGWNGQLGNVTTVGSAGDLSASYYETFDQGGNVAEWSETFLDPRWRGVRGGMWDSSPYLSRSARWYEDYPWAEYLNYGFRVAFIPEPSCLAAALIAALGLGVRVVRRSRSG